jgi:hypothetical protein
MSEAGNGIAADYVQAYLWLDLAARTYAGGADRQDAIAYRDCVASKMTADQIATAKKLVLEWRSTKSK